MLRSYKDLKVWQKSYNLCLDIYKLTKGFPREERYNLTSQIRRSAVSVPSNIAEGYGRKSSKEYAQFYSISYGSALELETQIIISKDLSFTPLENFGKVDLLLEEVSRMLNSMIFQMRQLNARR